MESVVGMNGRNLEKQNTELKLSSKKSAFIDDITFEISTNLLVKEFSVFSQVAKSFKAVSAKDNIWLRYLIRDFHFTVEMAKALKNRLQTTYQKTYLYCKGYQFNQIQMYALDKFKDAGIIKYHFYGRDEFNDESHVIALDHLLFIKKYSIDEALQKMNGLDKNQVRGVVNDVPKEELQLLTSEEQIFAIRVLYEYGIRASHLHDLKRDFTYLHVFALKDLIKEKNDTLGFSALIKEVSQLTFKQCQVLHESYQIKDLIYTTQAKRQCKFA